MYPSCLDCKHCRDAIVRLDPPENVKICTRFPPVIVADNIGWSQPIVGGGIICAEFVSRDRRESKNPNIEEVKNG